LVEHVPVLLDEALDGLGLGDHDDSGDRAGLYVDATFGRGGHTARLLAALGPEGRVLAIDRDPQAIAAAAATFATESRLQVAHAPFGELAALLHERFPARPVRGVLFDLGVSSAQIDQPQRGFSFQTEGPLDMRMDPTRGRSAAQWLAIADHAEIRDVISRLGEERFASRVASAIVAARDVEPLQTTAQLSRLVAGAVRTREPGKNPATRSFQAIRMHINDELGEIERGLAGALRVLAPGGRLVVISFHSLEDRLVKQFMRRESQPDPQLAKLPMLPPGYAPRLDLVGRKHKAGDDELRANPRSRSAILRVAVRTEAA
jgi:16S rRNA (cytosine1402-N4)-methyltransferase